MLFTVEDRAGALDDCLRVFKRQDVSLKHIESRPGKNFTWDYDFMVEFDLQVSDIARLEGVIRELESAGARSVQLVGASVKSDGMARLLPLANRGLLVIASVPWFPRKLADLDTFASKTLEYGSELAADHPGFTDPEYRERRAEITAIARTHKTYPELGINNVLGQGNGDSENRVHGQRAGHLAHGIQLGPQAIRHSRVQGAPVRLSAARAKLRILPGQHPAARGRLSLPQRCPVACAMTSKSVECTGFQLRPVMGLLSSRDFLNGLAFRVFHSTQYPAA